MTKLSPTLIASACALVIVGCSPQLNEARRAAQADSPFGKVLQTGYLQLAQDEFDEFDEFNLVDTDVFAGRALKLANGQRVAPERIS